MKLAVNLFLIIGILFGLEVSAEDVVEQEPIQVEDFRGEQRSGWYLSGGFINIDETVAVNEAIDDSAFYLNGGWEGHKGNFAYSVGASGYFLSDNDSFSQEVEDAFGNRSTASSDANAFGLFGELGYNYGFESGDKAFEIMAGAEAIWADRGIANCSNCYSEDIDLSSGLYIKPRFRFYNENGFIFSVGYHHYLSGDLDNGFSLSFSWTR